ncbi:hypothetical protein GCM10027286_22630 [Virgibacillus ainsalahensis]
MGEKVGIWPAFFVVGVVDWGRALVGGGSAFGRGAWSRVRDLRSCARVGWFSVRG